MKSTSHVEYYDRRLAFIRTAFVINLNHLGASINLL